jgi:hypothetical protein
VAVEYGPQLVSGSAIFLAFKLGVTDIYSKALPTIALQKTSSQKTTVEGAFFARRGCASYVLPRACEPSSNHPAFAVQI